MEKTFTINISGQIFNINESAFVILEKYLNALKVHFTKIEGGDEIIIDIEMRIAELLNEKLQRHKVVVTKEDIQEIISILGEVEDFIEDDEQESSESKSKQKSETTEKNKQLYRDTEDNVFGGVARGLAYYLGINVIFVRLAFIVLLFAFTSGFWIYIILWLVIPNAKTSVQKLEMKGEPINISNIEKSIREEFGKVKDNIESGKLSDKLGYHVNRIFNVFFQILKFIFKFIGKTIGVILILISVLLISTLIGSFSMDLVPISQFVDLFYNNQNSDLILISIFSALFVPFIVLLYVGLKQIFRIEAGYKTFMIIALIFWMFSLVFLGLNTASVANEFKEHDSLEKKYELSVSDTIYVNENDIISGVQYDFKIDSDIYLKKTNLFLEPDFIIKNHDKPNVEVKVVYKAEGKNMTEASDMIKLINFDYKVDSNSISYDSHYNFGKVWRKQEVKIYIYKPDETEVIYRDN